MKRNKVGKEKKGYLKLFLGEQGELSRGIWYRKNRKPQTLKGFSVWSQYCDQKIMVYGFQSNSINILFSYDFFRNSPDSQWIELYSEIPAKICISNIGSTVLDVYYGWERRHWSIESM